MASLKILIVEDDLPSLELMAEVFSSLEADVRPLSDSQKAAGLVDQEKFGGVFLDLGMPGLDGLEPAPAIRQSSRNKSTPTIIWPCLVYQDTQHAPFPSQPTSF